MQWPHEPEVIQLGDKNTKELVDIQERNNNDAKDPVVETDSDEMKNTEEAKDTEEVRDIKDNDEVNDTLKMKENQT